MKVYEAQLRYQIVRDRTPLLMNRATFIAAYMRPLIEAHPMAEAFYVLSLNRKNRLLLHTMVTLGTANAALAHPREVFRPAVLANASAIAVCHNHPSGDPAPSLQDVQVTSQLREASKVMDITLIDHVIVGEVETDPLGLGYYSFRAAGMI